MNTFNMNAISVAELSPAEIREINGGGWFKSLVATAVDLYENWDAYVAAFKKGLADGNKAL